MSKKFTPARSRNFLYLIILACHGVYKGGDPNKDESWWGLANFQKGQTPCFVKQALEAIRLLRENPNAVLGISGGVTKSALTPEAESTSYLRMLEYLGVLDDELRARIYCDTFALDSFQNLAFGLAVYYLREGRLPLKTTVVSFPFKRSRFIEHSRAVGLSSAQFDFLGVGDPPNLTAAVAGEQRTREEFLADPYGCGPVLRAKREARTPPLYLCPYPDACRSSPRLSAIFDRMGDIPACHRGKSFCVHYLRRGHADWIVRDSNAAALAINRLRGLGFVLDSLPRVEHPAPEYEQQDGPFEDIPAKRWKGSLGDVAHLRLVDMVYFPTRPPLDEEGKKHLPRSHDQVALAGYKTFRKFFDTCSRKCVELAPAFKEQLDGNDRRFGCINYQVFDTRETEEKKRTDRHFDRSAYLAEYRETGLGEVTRDCHATCAYLIYSGTPNELGTAVLTAFGLSGADTHRFLEMICTRHDLGAVFDDVVLNTGSKDRLVLVEMTRNDAGGEVEVGDIIDMTAEATVSCQVG